MKKGLLYGIIIVLILVGLFVWKPIAGLIALALGGAWIWNYDPPYEIDADLRASTKEIVKEIDPVPEKADNLPFIENEGTDPFIAGEAAMRNLVESLEDDSYALNSFLKERTGSPREDMNVNLAAVKPPSIPKEHIFSAADNQSNQPR